LPTTGRRYDLVLAVSPFAFVLGASVAALAGTDPTIGFRAGSVVALAAVVYALFGLSPSGPRGA
jgi:hypothetical protein